MWWCWGGGGLWFWSWLAYFLMIDHWAILLFKSSSWTIVPWARLRRFCKYYKVSPRGSSLHRIIPVHKDKKMIKTILMLCAGWLWWVVRLVVLQDHGRAKRQKRWWGSNSCLCGGWLGGLWGCFSVSNVLDDKPLYYSSSLLSPPLAPAGSEVWHTIKSHLDEVIFPHNGDNMVNN